MYAPIHRILVLALLLVVATSGAAEAATPQLLPGSKLDGPQWSDTYYGASLRIPLRCDAPAAHPTFDPVDPAARCVERFPLLGSVVRFTGNDMKPVGTPIPVGEVSVDLALGEQVVVDAAMSSAFFDKIVRPNRRKLVGVQLTLPAPPGGTQLPTLTPAFTSTPSGNASCGVPDFVRTAGPAPVVHLPTGGTRSATVTTRAPRPYIPAAVWVSADTGPLSFTVSGLTFTAAKGTRFRLMCLSIGSVSGGMPFLAPEMTTGAFTISGTPTGKMRAANVITPEGALGTRAKERTKLVVTRNAKARISRLDMRRGATGGITPGGAKHQSPCTSGAKLQINAQGRITKG